MALKFFLMYAGVFLASSIVVLSMLKQLSSSFGNQGKKPWLFSFLTSIIASGMAFAGTYLSKNLFTTFWMLSGVFTLLGLLVVLLVHKKYFKVRRDNRNKQMFAEVLFGFAIIFLCIAIFSSLQYFIKDKNFMFFPTLLSSLFFFVPMLLLFTFDAAYDIPAPLYNTWQYPTNNPIELPDERENEKLYVIGFEIPKKLIDEKRTYFRAKAPEDMILGDLFYHFINDYNDQFSETPIEYMNKTIVPAWVFRTKPKWYNFSKILDPKLSVDKNGIRENTVIICERIIAS